MRNDRTALGIAILACLAAYAGTAGPRLHAQARERSSEEAGPQYIRGAFERAAPEIGQPMHDLTVYDRNGQEVRLHDVVNGRYTVLILGCLT